MSMMTLEEPWTYRTPLVTIRYPAGSHRVKREIHTAAINAGASKDDDNGSGDSEGGATGAGDDPSSKHDPDDGSAGDEHSTAN